MNINTSNNLPSTYIRSATVLGQHTLLPIDQSHALNDNVIVMGSSGTGKTYSFVKPNLLQMNTNYVVADAKGEILADVGSSLKQNGYDIRVLNLVNLKHSMSYNPLKYINNDLDLLSFADSVVTSSDDGKRRTDSDPFWTNGPRELLTALIAFTQEFLPKEDQNMNTVIDLFRLLDQPGAGEFKSDEMHTHLGYQLFEWARNQNPQSYAVRKWDTIVGMAGSIRTWASILGILGTALAPYEMRDVINLTYDDSLDFSSLLKPKTALFVMYDDADSSKNFISNIFYKQLFAFLFHESRKYPHQKLPEKVRFFLDDFKNVAIPGFEDYLATARSRNVSVCMMLQDESQLVAKYHEAAPSIIGNCATYILTGTSDLRMAQEASDRFLMTPRAIRRLPREYFLLDMSGSVKQDLRYDFTRHPNYNHMIYQLGNEIKIVDHVNQKDPNIERTTLDSLVEKIRGGASNGDEFSELANNVLNANNHQDSIFVSDNQIRESILDSYAENWMGNLLNQMFKETSFHVNPQIHLNSLFDADQGSLKQQIENTEMSVDFVITNNENQPLLGIEVDGSYHFEQSMNPIRDEYKNRTFITNGLPLVRVLADFDYLNSHVTEIAEKIKKALIQKVNPNNGYPDFGLIDHVIYLYGDKDTSVLDDVKALSDYELNLKLVGRV